MLSRCVAWRLQTCLYLILLFCILSTNDLLRFVFDLFAHGADNLGPGALHHLMLAANNGEPLFGSFKIPGATVSSGAGSGSPGSRARGSFTFSEFTALCRRQAGLLFPVFHTQDLLREATLGRAAWKSVIENAAVMEASRRGAPSNVNPDFYVGGAGAGLLASRANVPALTDPAERVKEVAWARCGDVVACRTPWRT